MVEVNSRKLNDGSGTVITLFHAGGDRFVVEAVNVNGVSSAEVDRSDALDTFNHPFCNEARLDYPTATRRSRQRELTAAEYALAEMIDRDEVTA